MHQPDEIISGKLVTPPCQGRRNRKPCHWPLTTKSGNLWLCQICKLLYDTRQMVRRIKRKLRDSSRRVT